MPGKDPDDYIWTAASQIANTPRVPLAEIPGSFYEEYSLAARQVPSIAPPAATKPTDDEFFVYDRLGGAKPDPNFLRSHFLREGRLSEKQAMFILHQATDVLSREPNMLAVHSPVTGELRDYHQGSVVPTISYPVCGDIHGQYVRFCQIHARLVFDLDSSTI
jgi:serine/threonine-protein phosphatase 2B catalytic subunit